MGPAIVLIVMLLYYGLNFSQAIFFREVGFLASILTRITFYLIWHVAYVHQR